MYFEYRGIPYEYIPVNLVKGEQRTEEYASKLNPAKVSLRVFIPFETLYDSWCHHWLWKMVIVRSLWWLSRWLSVSISRRCTQTCLGCCLLIHTRSGKFADFVKLWMLARNHWLTWAHFKRLKPDSVKKPETHGVTTGTPRIWALLSYWSNNHAANSALVMRWPWLTSSWSLRSTELADSRSIASSGPISPRSTIECKRWISLRRPTVMPRSTLSCEICHKINNILSDN